MNTDEINLLLLKTNAVQEEIQINQRELIMKILARYSGEFTVLRELIQNSNDAEAKKMLIKLIPI